MKVIKPILLLMQVILLLCIFGCSEAQFPTVCMVPNALQQSNVAKKCCPVFNNSECGSAVGRGECRSITLPDGSSVRDRWPYYFDQVCVCRSNYAGYDCSRCKYGYYGENCEYKKVINRKPISEYNTEKWKKYTETIAHSKTYYSGYSVFHTETQSDTSLPESTEVTLYNLFVWQHHYSAKDAVTLGLDYAHESTGFLTWHRQFLLWLEWEIQYMLKDDMKDEDYYKFRIPYWDWRKEMQGEKNSPFQEDRLGEKMLDNDGLPQVISNQFNDWKTICWSEHSSSVCNPQRQTGPLLRCPESCSFDNKLWPTNIDVKNVLSLTEYDTSPFSRYATNSFRNQLEGFKPLPQEDIQTCHDNKLCSCSHHDFNCTGKEYPMERLLHNSIHIILGLGHFGSPADADENKRGVMANVAASANDPIFLNHHAMVDCIFETWLKKNPNISYPTNDAIPQGHRAQDYIVPFFPLYKHQDMLFTADNFGYDCEIKSAGWSTKKIIGVVVGVVVPCAVVLCIVNLIGFLYICCKCKKKKPDREEVHTERDDLLPEERKHNKENI